MILRAIQYVFLSGILSGFTVPLMSQENEQADAYYQAQQYQRALDIYSQLDSSTTTLRKKANCEYQLGLLREAERTYLRVLHTDSLDITSISRLGAIYDQVYNLGKAIKYYRQLLSIDSTNSFYFKVNGLMHKKAGLISESFTYFAQALALNPRDVSVLHELAEFFLVNEQYSDADSLLQIAYQIDSTSVRTLLALGKLKYSIKAYDEAVGFLERTKGKLDLNAYYQKMLGYSYLQIDSFDIAIRHLRRLLDEESNEYTHYYLATAYSKKEDWENALYQYDQAIKSAVSPNLYIYHSNLADYYVSKKQRKKAMTHYEEAYRYSKQAKYIFRKAQLADEYYKDKQIAIRLFEKYLKSSPTRKEYIDYAKQRILYLKEYNHLSKS